MKYIDREKNQQNSPHLYFGFVPEESYPPICLLIFNLVQYK